MELYGNEFVKPAIYTRMCSYAPELGGLGGRVTLEGSPERA